MDGALRYIPHLKRCTWRGIASCGMLALALLLLGARRLEPTPAMDANATRPHRTDTGERSDPSIDATSNQSIVLAGADDADTGSGMGPIVATRNLLYTAPARSAYASEMLRDMPAKTETEAAETASAHLVAAPVLHPPRIIWMQVTAYCGCKKCCGVNAHGITASGRHISYNGGLFVAADTQLLPFNTQLIVPGYGRGEAVEVIDRGSAIRGRHIDVYFPTHEQAKEWGSRWLAVTVVSPQ